MNPSSQPPEGDPRPAPPRGYRRAQRIEAPITNLVGLSCREFARLAVTRLDRPLTTSESIRHRMHGAVCGLCARFAAQFSALNELTRELEAEAPATAHPAETAKDEAAARIAAAVRAAIDRSASG